MDVRRVPPWMAPRHGDYIDTPFGAVYSDVSGSDALSDLDMGWQAFASVGYKFDARWSVQLGYRYMAIEKKIGEAETSIDLYGPLLGVTAHF